MTDLAVIMSIYHNDRLSFLKESVQSILDQTFTQFHYYLVFDGPVSSEISSYINSLTDERIRLYSLEKNSGLASALNFLLSIVLKVADYKFIARMDADDISMPFRFEKQRDFLLENKDISVCGSYYEEIDESGKNLSYTKLPLEHEALRKRYFARTPFAHPSIMCRRELIEMAGFYPTDTVLMEDNVLWGMALKCGLKFANVPDYLLKFRIDRNFYKRRSGLRYGSNYILTRFKINRSLKLPWIFYFYSLVNGILKMMPPFLLKFFIGSHRYVKKNFFK